MIKGDIKVMYIYCIYKSKDLHFTRMCFMNYD